MQDKDQELQRCAELARSIGWMITYAGNGNYTYENDYFAYTTSLDTLYSGLEKIAENTPLNEDLGRSETVYSIAQDAVNLAHDVLTTAPDVQDSALKILSMYADIHKLKTLPAPLRRKLYVANYGEEEVQAMEESGEVNFK